MAETTAALWIEKHTPRDDILATNVHCRFKPRKHFFCDSRAYWVTAFAERRALVESWAYTEETLNRIGQFTIGFPLFPFDDPTLLHENDRNFTNPTAASLAVLREKHHVRWLFADSRAGRGLAGAQRPGHAPVQRRAGEDLSAEVGREPVCSGLRHRSAARVIPAS